MKVGSSKAMSFSSNLWKKESPVNHWRFVKAQHVWERVVLEEMQTNSVQKKKSNCFFQLNSDSFMFLENYIEFVSFFFWTNPIDLEDQFKKRKKFDKKKRKKWRKIWWYHFQSREHLYQNSQRGGFEISVVLHSTDLLDKQKNFKRQYKKWGCVNFS